MFSVCEIEPVGVPLRWIACKPAATGYLMTSSESLLITQGERAVLPGCNVCTLPLIAGVSKLPFPTMIRLSRRTAR